MFGLPPLPVSRLAGVGGSGGDLGLGGVEAPDRGHQVLAQAVQPAEQRAGLGSAQDDLDPGLDGGDLLGHPDQGAPGRVDLLRGGAQMGLRLVGLRGPLTLSTADRASRPLPIPASMPVFMALICSRTAVSAVATPAIPVATACAVTLPAYSAVDSTCPRARSRTSSTPPSSAAIASVSALTEPTPTYSPLPIPPVRIRPPHGVCRFWDRAGRRVVLATTASGFPLRTDALVDGAVLISDSTGTQTVMLDDVLTATLTEPAW